MFCKSQLVELQQSLPDFERAGVAVFAVSFDKVDILASFSAKFGITYPILSDQGSRFIDSLGLRNEHVAEQHAYYGVGMADRYLGVPYTGAFVLDENGAIVEKHFDRSHRVRPSAVTFIEESFGAESSLAQAKAEARTEDLRAIVWFDGTNYRTYERLRLRFAIEVAQGLHVYGRPTPEGYTPLTIAFDPLEGLEVGEIELPEARPFQVAGLDEHFVIYEGTIRGALPVLPTQNLGETTFTVRVRYQACSEDVCYPPTELTLQLSLTGLDHIK